MQTKVLRYNKGREENGISILFVVSFFLFSCFVSFFLTGCGGGGSSGDSGGNIGANQVPVADFTVTPNLGIAPLAVNFDASRSKDPDGIIINYEWDFEDDGKIDYAGPGAVAAFWTYDTPGQKIACLRVTDDKGGVDEIRNGIVVFSAWEMTNGPYRGSVASLAVDPQNASRIFVALGRGGFFLSEDGGLSWNHIEGPFMNSRPIAVAISSTEPEIIYIGTEIHGVYKSTDGGNSWIQVSSGLPPYLDGYQPVAKISIDPTTSNVAYALIWEGYYIYKTENGGQSWFQVFDGTLISDAFIGLVINSTNPDTIYASCFYQTGVWKSENGGDTWIQKNIGLPAHTGGYFQTRRLGIDPNNPDQVYVGMFDYGLYTTDNGGESWYWAEIFPGPSRRTIKSISIDPTNSLILYVGLSCPDDISKQGLWKTEDGGASWEPLPYFEGMIPSLVKIAPSDSSTVFVRTEKNDLYKRSGGDDKWEKIDKGLVDVAVNAISNILPFDNTIYAGTESDGVFVTTDGGSDWIQINNDLAQLASPLYIAALAVDPNYSQRVYVGTYDDGVFFTNDAGETWIDRNTPDLNKYVRAIAIYPANSEVLYVGTRGGVFKTENGGLAWVGKNTGLTDPWVRCLAIDPTNSLVLYAGTGYQGESGGVFKTTNGGEMWEDVSTGLPNKPVRSLAIYPIDNQIVYAAFKGEGVYLTQDGGENWVQKNNGLTSTNVVSLTISQQNDKIAYAGTEDEGVFITIDGGDNWVQIDKGLTSDLNRCINAIAVAPDDETAYAGTGCGVFKAYK